MFSKFKKLKLATLAFATVIAGGAVADTIKIEQIREIAENKMKDLNASSIDGAIEMVKGSARSMGLEVLE